MRIRLSTVALLSAACVGALAQTQPAPPDAGQRFVASLRALNSMNTASIVYSGAGSAAVSIDGRKPPTAAPVKKYRAAINYGMGMSRVEFERDASPKRVTQYFANGVAWDVVDNGAPKPNPGAAAERLRAIAMSPHGAMRAAFDPAGKRATSIETGPDGKPVAVATFTVSGLRLKAYFDDDSILTRVQSLDEPDVEFLYSDYRDVDTVRPPLVKPGTAGTYTPIHFPFRIVGKAGGRTVLDLTLTDVVPNAGLYVEVPEAIEAVQK